MRIALLLSLILASPALADTWYVSTTGSDTNSGTTQSEAFCTINHAIQQASSGDTINILPGTYKAGMCGSMVPDGYVIINLTNAPYHTTENFYLNIIGTGGNENTIIDGSDSDGNPAFKGLMMGIVSNPKNPPPPIYIYTLVQGITFQNCTGVLGGAIEVANGSIEIKDCVIKDSVARFGGGIFCGNDCGTIGASQCYYLPPTFTNCVIKDNSANWGGGILCQGTESILTDCTIINNSVSSLPDVEESGQGGGVLLWGTDGAGGGGIWMNNCTISNNTAESLGGGLYLEGVYASIKSCKEFPCKTTLTNCTISGNTAYEGGGGIYSNTTSDCAVDCPEYVNTFTDCLITNNSALGKLKAPSSVLGGGIFMTNQQVNTLVDGCTISGNIPEGIHKQPNCDDPTASLDPVTLKDTVICNNGIASKDDVMTSVQISGESSYIFVGASQISADCNVTPELGDLNSDGCVDAADLGMLLAAWSFCP